MCDQIAKISGETGYEIDRSKISSNLPHKQ